MIDTAVPLDTATLARGEYFLDIAVEAARAANDTVVLMNLAVMYYEHGNKLVQARIEIPKAVEWLEKALENDVQRRLTEPASFFLGLGLLYRIFDFDPEIVEYADPQRIQNLSTDDRDAACGLVEEEAAMVERGKEAMTIGASLSQQTADQFLGHYSNFEQRIPQLREAFKCPS